MCMELKSSKGNETKLCSNLVIDLSLISFK